MKTKTTVAPKGCYVLFITGILLFTSCHVYKPLAGSQNNAPEEIKDRIQPGRSYAFLTEIGETVYIKVDSVMSDRVIGNARIKGSNGTVRANNFTVYLRNVVSAKESKFSLPLTLGVCVGACLATVLIASPLVWNSFQPF